MKKFLFAGMLFMLVHAQAQYYTAGQDPFLQRWRQLTTPGFRFIYPENWEGNIQELAKFHEMIRPPLSSQLGSNPSRIPVVLRSQSMLSNGFVMWAPKRVEMITSVPYDHEASDWINHLTIHEFRHVAQVEAANVSTTRFLSRIFGQHITGAVTGLHLPLWFLEGDAVLAETIFSKAGRGRLPSFYMPLAAQLAEKEIYSYDKAIFGSYRDMNPNHYVIGYHLVSGIQKDFGFQPFRQGLHRSGTVPFLPARFSGGVKQVTGKRPEKLYRQIFSNLAQQWKTESGTTQTSEFVSVSSTTRLDYANYHNPHFLDSSGAIIAVRTAPSDIPRVVVVNENKKDSILFSPGYGFYNTFSYASGRAVWTEITYDPRWSYRVYSNIRVLDLAGGKSRLIGGKQRLQSPGLSADGKKIVAIELDEINKWRLVLVDAESGEELYSYSNNSFSLLQDPCFDEADGTIVAVGFEQTSGKWLVAINPCNQTIVPLFNAGHTQISHPVVYDGIIYFTGAWSGKDEIYAFDRRSEHVSRCVNTPFGAMHAKLSTDGGTIVFNNLTSEGTKIAKAGNKPGAIVDPKGITDSSPRLFLRGQQETIFPLKEIAYADTIFPTRKFNKLLNALHFHSWAPAYLDVAGMTAGTGLTFFSQDLLGSTVFSGGYQSVPENKGNWFFADLSLKAFYPVLSVRNETGWEDRHYRTGDQTTVKLKTDVYKLTGSASLPLSFQTNSILWGFSPRVSTSQEFYVFTYQNKENQRSIQSMSYRMYLYAYRRMALRDLFPRLGIASSFQFSHTPFAGDNTSNRIDAGTRKIFEVSTYLPGLLRHHSFRAYYGKQFIHPQRTYFTSALPFARGYTSPSSPSELTTLLLRYSFPLAYPDLAVGSLLYAKRLKATLFYDFSYRPLDGGSRSFESAGLDVLADVHLLRMPMPFELGFRFIYRLNDNKPGFKLVWSVDFYTLGRLFGSGSFAPLVFK